MNDQFTLPPSYHSFVASGRYDGPDAPALKKFYIYSDVPHTHTPRQAGIFPEECEAEQNVRIKSGYGSLYTYRSGGSAQFSKGDREVKKSVLR